MKTFGSKSYQDAEDKLKCGLDSLGQFVSSGCMKALIGISEKIRRSDLVG